MNTIYQTMKNEGIFSRLTMMCGIISAQCADDVRLEKWYENHLKEQGFSYTVNDNVTVVKFTDGKHLIRVFLI